MRLSIKKDIEKDYICAVKYYEVEIQNEENIQLDSYTNLAFIYWEFSFDLFGFLKQNNIPDDFSLIGQDRHLEILDLGLKVFPNNLELLFWKSYFPSIIHCTGFPQNELENLSKTCENEDNLVPYFLLYLFDNEKYRSKAMKLNELCKNQPTANNLYISSILQI